MLNKTMIDARTVKDISAEDIKTTSNGKKYVLPERRQQK